MQIKKEVYGELKKHTKFNFNDQSPIKEIGIDSFVLIDLITLIEDKYKIRISDDELESIKNVGDIVNALDKAIASKKD